MSRRSWRVLAAILGLAAFGVAGRAQQTTSSDMTIVGTFYNYDGKSALFVVTTKPTTDKASKGAVVGVQFENSDEKYRYNGTYTKLMVAFGTAADWRKFVAIWRKARAASGEAKDEFYFDGQNDVGVGRTGRGEISFALAGNGHDKQNNPKDLTIFFLSPKDIAAFDRDVNQVSAYFSK